MAVTLFFEREPSNELVDTYTLCWAARWRGPGETFVPDSEYRFLGIMNTDEASIELGGAYAELFGEAPVDSLIPCKAFTLNFLTGLTSTPIYTRAIVEV